MIDRGDTPVLRRIDFLVLLPALALIAIGLLSMYSATHDAAVYVKFQKQVAWVVLGMALMVLVMTAPARFYHYSAYIVYAVSLVLLVAVLLVGRSIGGNAGWFGVAGFGIQPSEFAKIATIICLARFLSDSTTSLSTFRDLLVALGVVFVPWLLIFLQPDFGTGLVYWACFLPMIFWSGAEMILLLTLVSPVIIAVLAIFDVWLFLGAAVVISIIFTLLKRNIGIALLFITLNLSVGFSVQYMYDRLPDYQKERIAVFMDPSRAPKSAGYNVLQSKVAIGSGGFAGRGYLHGSQTQLRFVPEQSTDFIFCVPAEEFGFVGAAVILALYGLLLFRGMRIARNAPFRFTGIMVLGLTSMLFFHVFVNVSMSLGMLPVVGIPLPFMSYGGSFFLSTMIAIGLILHASFHRHRFE